MSNMLSPETDETMWIFAEEPGKTGIRQRMAVALMIGVKTMVETHVYSFRGHNFLQSDGGPIGLRFTGTIARIRMNHWQIKF